MRREHVVWIVLIAIGSAVCWRVAQSAPVKDEDAELYRLFVDVVESVDRSYVREVDRRKLIEAAINGLLESLDSHSAFITRENLTRFERETTGKFGGIGVHIGEKLRPEEFLQVIGPLYGTPAYRAGIIANDRILKVNGESVKGLSQQDVIDRISGPPGSEVTLTIQHAPHQNPPVDVKLIREIIKIDTVHGDHRRPDDRWDFFVGQGSGVAYVRVTGFSQETPGDLERTLRQLLTDGMKGLVLDLRYNPGGLLSSAVEVADLFIADGQIVLTKGRNTVEKPFEAKQAGTLPSFPMVILVNEFSASATEIVAACLQDHKRALVVGERTFGKGSVQNVIELEGGHSAIKLTTAAYRRPNGKNIHRFPDSRDWGVQPNPGYEIKFAPADHKAYFEWRRERDLLHGRSADGKPAAQIDKKDAEKPPEKTAAAASFKDRQLEKAIDYLSEQLKKSGEKIAQGKPGP
jgi:carboxyl-terminal processing protease